MKVTSRERPDQLLETIRQYIDMSINSKDMIWLFSFDYNDNSYNVDFCKTIIEMIDPDKRGDKCLISSGYQKNKIEAINRDVDAFNGSWDILLNISDDQRPIVKGYDDIIRRAMPDDLDASLWFTDGQDKINTQEIIGINYYNRFGYIYNPEFKSLWCDNLSTDLALFLGKIIRSDIQIVRHFHPGWGLAKMDDLYRRNDRFWNEDELTYRKLISEGLDKLIK